MYTSYPTHEAHPTQEGPSHQGPPEWFLEYFGRLDKSLGEIKLQQANIIQNQKRQAEYMGHLESAYYGLRHDMDRLRNLYVEQLS